MSPLGSPASYFAESGVEVFLAADFDPALLVEAAAAVFFLADEAVVFAVVVFLVEADLVVFVAVFVAVVFAAEDFAAEALAAEVLAAEVLVADFAVVFLAVEAFVAVVFAVAAERLGAGFLVGAALGSVIGASV